MNQRYVDKCKIILQKSAFLLMNAVLISTLQINRKHHRYLLFQQIITTAWWYSGIWSSLLFGSRWFETDVGTVVVVCDIYICKSVSLCVFLLLWSKFNKALNHRYTPSSPPLYRILVFRPNPKFLRPSSIQSKISNNISQYW